MATKRLIDANDLWVDIMMLPHNGDIISSEEVEQAIKDAPTVDAVEVVRGHWCWEGRFRACSECGSYVEFTETLGASHWKYCPYCGAKMDGDGNG